MTSKQGRMIQIVLLCLISVTAGMVLAMIIQLFWFDNEPRPIRPGDESFFQYVEDEPTRDRPGSEASLGDGLPGRIEVWFQVRSEQRDPLSATIRLEPSRRRPIDQSGSPDALTAQTDPEGRIALVIPQGIYRLVVIPDDSRYRDRDMETEFREEEAGRELAVMTQLRQTSIVGRVVEKGDDGRDIPLPGIRVILDEGGRLEQETTTGANGDYGFEHLPGGRHRLRLSLGDLEDVYLVPPESSLVVADSQNERIIRRADFSLKRAARIEGRVLRVDGTAAVGVRVQATAKNGRSWVCAVDQEGRFLLRGFPQADYVIQVLHPWSAQRLSGPVERSLFSSQSSPIDFEVEAPAGTLSGRVIDPRGEGISEAKVILSYLEPAPPRVVLTDSEGRYQFEGLWPGSYPLRVEPPEISGWITTEASLAVGEVGEKLTSVELRLGDEAALVVIPRAGPLDEQKSTLAYSVEVVRGGRFLARRRFAQDGGRPLRVGGLSAGPIRVSLRNLGENDRVLDEASWSYELRSGEVARLDEDLGWLHQVLPKNEFARSSPIR